MMKDLHDRDFRGEDFIHGLLIGLPTSMAIWMILILIITLTTK